MSPWLGIDEFVAVATLSSFSRAAEKLGRSTSQVSRDIADLEDRLSVRLLNRTTRQVRLTDPGRHFLEHCRKLIEARDEAIAQISDERRELHGPIRVTCSVAYGERFVVPVITSFARRHPQLNVDIELTDKVLDLVAEGFDLGVRFGNLADSSLVAVRLASRRRRLCASPEYLASAGQPKSLADLSHHACLLGASAIWSFRLNGKAFEFRPTGRWRCNSGMATLDAALQGLGLCKLPDFYVAPHIKSGALIPLLEEYTMDDEGVWAVYPHRRHLPAKVKSLIQFMQIELPGVLKMEQFSPAIPVIENPKPRWTRLTS